MGKIENKHFIKIEREIRNSYDGRFMLLDESMSNLSVKNMDKFINWIDFIIIREYGKY